MEEKLEQQPADCLRVVLYGPESTGKTTLARKLAAHFDTEWVPEFSRDYLQQKWDSEKKVCETHDILPIARGQMALENRLAKKANKILFCDTNLLETVVYSRAYYNGYCDPLLLKHALKAKYDLYILTYIDLPWVKDDLRDRPGQRDLMFAKFKEALDEYELPYRILKGNFQERFDTAVEMIVELLKEKTLGLSSEDVSQIEKKGLTVEEVERQINVFKRGNIVVDVIEAATPKNGIDQYSEEEMQGFSAFYESRKDQLEVLKFVPASGAATRMFKSFYKFLDEFDPNEGSLEDFLDRKNDPVLERFFGRMKDLPFYNLVQQKMWENHQHVDSLTEDQQQLLFVKTMLLEDGLNFGNFAKGLVPFHKYEDKLVTAFEEHFIEAVAYATSNGVARLHFTVAEDQHDRFEKEYQRIKDRLEKETQVKFQVSFSYQDPKTDTVAVTVSNEPFRDANGKIFFRPGGHGALIDNLNNQQADLVFIKNIDNVVVPRHREVVANYKKALGGRLLQLQEKTFEYLRKLEKGELQEEELGQMVEFLQKELNSGLSIKFDELTTGEKMEALKRKMNRPFRICGMVKNEGEPGGGPFWVKHQTGDISLQIVESSQIDHDNYQQSKIAQEATHFNPVDVVCGLKDFKGKRFNLPDFVDQDTSFISNKTKDGRDLKALEHPGLWNGGMANWISIFVEVPIETFNPVKTVADLLKPTHQVR